MLLTTSCNRCGRAVQGYAGSVATCAGCGNQGMLPALAAGPQVIVVQQQAAPAQKDVLTAYLLWFFLGFWGIHKFYLGRTGEGVLYIFTLGLCGLGWFIDMFLIPGQVEAANEPD